MFLELVIIIANNKTSRCLENSEWEVMVRLRDIIGIKKVLFLEFYKDYSCAFEAVRTLGTILNNYNCKYLELLRLTIDVMTSK